MSPVWKWPARFGGRPSHWSTRTRQRRREVLLDKKIVQQLQSLPQELKDRILDFVVSFNIGVVHCYNRKLTTTPVDLHINRALRQQTAEEYYRRSRFHLSAPDDKGWKTSLAFLSSRPQEHRALMGNVSIAIKTSFTIGPESVTDIPVDDLPFTPYCQRRDFMSEWAEKGLSEEAVRMRVIGKGSELDMGSSHS